MARRRAGLMSAAVGGALICSAPAIAKEVPFYVAPGMTGSAIFGEKSTVGYGLELTVGKIPWPLSVAGLFQYDWFDDGSTRRAIGAQINGPFVGVELAWSHRASGAESSDGLQIAPFGTIGLAYIGARIVISSGPHGNEFGAVVGLKLPIPTGDIPLNFGVPHGRPLRDAQGVIQLGDVVLLPGNLPPIPDLDAATRQAIGQAWLTDARMEHASVATFRQLAGWLQQLGAPEALSRAALRAAADEARHAEACFALADRYLGVRSVAEPLCVPTDPPPPLAKLAIDSLVEGLLGEGVAARQAELALARTHDPLAHATLTAIAREEAEHARLARAIIEWSRSRAPQVVDAALAKVRLPQTLAVRAGHGAAGQRHGRATPAQQRRAFAEVRGQLAA